MRVVRQILVGLGLIVIGVGGVVLAQGIIVWTGSHPALVEAIATTVLGALLLAGGVALLVAGIRKRPAMAMNAGAEA
jgi:hypothetical protein